MKKIILSAMIRTTSYFVLALALGACGKLNLGETSVTGTVTNLTTNSPEAGKLIYLVEYESTAGVFSPIVVSVIESTVTDDQGHFSFEADLSRRNKYGYEVEFDTEGMKYMSHAWQSGDYESVSMIAKVDPGKENLVSLGTVPYGEVKLAWVNNAFQPVDVEAWLSNDRMSARVFLRNIEANESSDFGAELPFPAGEALLTWTVTHGSVTETFIQEVNLIHDEVLEVVFTYPN